jgi:hypothetical protein
MYDTYSSCLILYLLRHTHHEVLHYAVFSILLLLLPCRTSIFPSTLFLNILNLCFYSILRNQVPHPYNGKSYSSVYCNCYILRWENRKTYWNGSRGSEGYIMWNWLGFVLRLPAPLCQGLLPHRSRSWYIIQALYVTVLLTAVWEIFLSLKKERIRPVVWDRSKIWLHQLAHISLPVYCNLQNIFHIILQQHAEHIHPSRSQSYDRSIVPSEASSPPIAV